MCVAKDIGMTIRKGIVVSFLPLLFGDSIPIYVLLFFKVFFVTCFCCFLGGGERYDGVVVWGR